VLLSDQTQPAIFTPRLVLHHISPRRLFMLFEDPENESVVEGCTYTNPHRVLIDDQGPVRWRAPQVKENPDLNKWFLRWLVLRETNEIVGSISFHGEPNADGMIEIGLGVDEGFRNNGYAREALLGMWSWASDEPLVKVLRYTVSATNLPSVKIVKGFDFDRVGVQMDKEDGPEEIYELTALEFRQRLATPWRGQ
jgi:[ribosomal protein S5]-alanine N-acetyltransferase